MQIAVNNKKLKKTFLNVPIFQFVQYISHIISYNIIIIKRSVLYENEICSKSIA